MKTVVWYLPSGAGGMAAYYKTYHVKKQLLEWAESKEIVIDTNKQLTISTVNGLRYYHLTLSDNDATIFALSWNNNNPGTRYEYIR